MINFSAGGLILLFGTSVVSGASYQIHTFQKLRLTDQFWSEGANFGDFNHDGKKDVVSGPFWWEGPDFKIQHEYAEGRNRSSPGGKAPFRKKSAEGVEEIVPGFEGALGKANAYSDNFFAFTYDLNQDGWDDILIYGYPGQDASWYENPKGKRNADGTEHWMRHKAFDVVDNESPTWGDLTGDGKPEIIFHSGGYLGYATPNWDKPAEPWTFHKISPKGGWQKFTHGYGYGDVNGDGRKDVLEASGWWEQPKSLEGDPEWVKHPANFGKGGAQMYAYDVNGDGLNDVITSIEAHGYGISWFQQVREDGKETFKEHRFVGSKPEDNKYGVKFSQPHALELVDMDGDGLKDLVTGKRFWAHGSGGDVEPGAPAVLYWFKLVRNKDKSVDWIPHLIDNDSGIGTQVVAGDLNGDKLPDVVVGNKKGTFVHLHSVQKVSKAEWEKVQPKPTGSQE